MPPMIVWATSALLCPFFTEFFPDPTEVSDAAGEFIEIALDSTQTDTLWIQQEDKVPIPFFDLKGKRVLFHRDSVICNENSTLSCRSMSFSALPNSRESLWILKQGDCIDSAYLPVTKSGKSIQRIGSDYKAWEYSTPTPGFPNSKLEPGTHDCELKLLKNSFQSGKFKIDVTLEGCDSASVYYERELLDFSERKISGTFFIQKIQSVSFPSDGTPEKLRLILPEDDVSSNDTLNLLMISKEKSPVALTEIHFCPAEGYSEWVELYNSLPVSLPIETISFCNRSVLFSGSLGAYESVLISRDSTQLREEIGFNDVRLIKMNFGTLKNTADTLCLCHANDTLQCVSWGKPENHFCPQGFNPKTHRKENTPGMQNNRMTNNLNNVPFDLEINKRILSKRTNEEIRVKIEGDVLVQILLHSENGTLLWHKNIEKPQGEWIHIPLESFKPGIYFLKCKSGSYEKNFGLVLRP